MGELKVGCAGSDGRWVDGSLVDVPGVGGGRVGGGGVAVPVIGDFVVVHHVNPLQVLRG